MDMHDIEWKCSCGHTSPDCEEACNGCGDDRYPEDGKLSESDRLSEIEQEQFSDRVEEEMEAIIREEGTTTVKGIYIANQYDCATARQYEAERRVREKARQREIALRSEVRRVS